MKLVTFGKINKKFFLYALLYILIIFFLNSISYILIKQSNSENKIFKNQPIMLIIINSSLIFFIIFEFCLRKAKPNQEKEINSNDENFIDIKDYNKKEKRENLIKLIILVLMIVLDFIYEAGLMIYQITYERQSKFVFGEIFKFLDVLFLLFIFRCFHKILFYRHQYVSLFFIILMGLGLFFIPLLYDNNYINDFKNNINYLFFIFAIFCPLIDSITIYFLQKYMIYNYYSPFFICFLIGLIFSIISIIILFIFNNNCGDYCNYLSYENIESPSIGEVFLLIFYSICYSSMIFMKLWTIYSFSAFHLILIVTFGEVIIKIFKLISDFSYYNLILIIIAYLLEIFGVLVFIEAIELNFCGMNINLQKNIIFRAGSEVDNIYKIESEEGSENMDNNIIDDANENDNLVYE